MTGPTFIVLADIADGTQFVPIDPFDDPVSGVIVDARATTGRPDCRHDIESIIGPAIKAIQGEILMVTRDPAGRWER